MDSIGQSSASVKSTKLKIKLSQEEGKRYQALFKQYSVKTNQTKGKVS